MPKVLRPSRNTRRPFLSSILNMYIFSAESLLFSMGECLLVVPHVEETERRIKNKCPIFTLKHFFILIFYKQLMTETNADDYGRPPRPSLMCKKRKKRKRRRRRRRNHKCHYHFKGVRRLNQHLCQSQKACPQKGPVLWQVVLVIYYFILWR